MGAMFAMANAVEVEREPLLSWAPKKCWPPQSSPCEQDIKRDYFVPNFGEDHDIAAAQKHIKDAETELKHNWVPALKGKPDPTDYRVPDFGMDHDIVNTKNSISSS